MSTTKKTTVNPRCRVKKANAKASAPTVKGTTPLAKLNYRQEDRAKRHGGRLATRCIAPGGPFPTFSEAFYCARRKGKPDRRMNSVET